MSWQTRALVLLGSTGSVGINALAVAQSLGLRIHGLCAGRQVAQLAAQARRHHVQRAVIGDESLLPDLRQALAGSGIEAAAGPAALCDLAADPAAGCVLTAIVGGAGLAPTLAAVRAGKHLCIANKEPLAMAGALITAEARRHGAHLVPVDSEHSALFQALGARPLDEVERLLITGSGGPLRTVSDLSQVTRDQALTHPTWQMGPKITIDSATLMNKAIELIEARWLFDCPMERLEVLIHPQSIIHSMVHFRDGSLIAQLAKPDMRVPIQYALTWPEHALGPVAAPSLAELAQLSFEAPDHQRFPSLGFARAAMAAGPLAVVAMNAANECAVAAFLAGRIGFIDIFTHIEQAIEQAPRDQHADESTILACDSETRRRSQERLGS